MIELEPHLNLIMSLGPCLKLSHSNINNVARALPKSPSTKKIHSLLKGEGKGGIGEVLCEGVLEGEGVLILGCKLDKFNRKNLKFLI